MTTSLDRGQQALDAELDPRAHELEHLVELVGGRAELAATCSRVASNSASRAAASQRTTVARCTPYICASCSSVTPPSKCRRSRLRSRRVSSPTAAVNAGDERVAVLRLDQRQLDVAGRRRARSPSGSGSSRSLVADPIDRGARRGDLHEAAQPAAAGVVEHARRALAVGEQQLVAHDRRGRPRRSRPAASSPASAMRDDVEVRRDRTPRSRRRRRARTRARGAARRRRRRSSGGGSSPASLSASARSRPRLDRDAGPRGGASRTARARLGLGAQRARGSGARSRADRRAASPRSRCYPGGRVTCLDDATVLGLVEGRLAAAAPRRRRRAPRRCASCRDVVAHGRARAARRTCSRAATRSAAT